MNYIKYICVILFVLMGVASWTGCVNKDPVFIRIREAAVLRQTGVALRVVHDSRGQTPTWIMSELAAVDLSFTPEVVEILSRTTFLEDPDWPDRAEDDYNHRILGISVSATSNKDDPILNVHVLFVGDSVTTMATTREVYGLIRAELMQGKSPKSSSYEFFHVSEK